MRLRPFGSAAIVLTVLLTAASLEWSRGAPAAPATAPAARPTPDARPAPATAPAAARAKKPPVEEPPSVEKAVAALIEEANERFRDDTPKLITIVRPHPAVARLTSRHANQVLSAMRKKLTGDPLKDVYIRYHLMHVVNGAMLTTLEPFTKDLLGLAALVPDNINF